MKKTPPRINIPKKMMNNNLMPIQKKIQTVMTNQENLKLMKKN